MREHWLAAITLGVLTSHAAIADVVAFSSAGAATNFSNGFRYTFLPSFTAETELGFLFTSSESGFLTRIEVAATSGSIPSQPSYPLTLRLYANNAGVPGPLLTSINASIPNFTAPNLAPLSGFTPSNAVLLNAGTSYFLTLSRPADSLLYWHIAQGASNGTQVATGNFGTGPGWTLDNQPFGAFRISVPSPAVGGTLAAGCLVLFARRRR